MRKNREGSEYHRKGKHLSRAKKKGTKGGKKNSNCSMIFWEQHILRGWKKGEEPE